jgi:lysozyme family protein
MPPRKRKAAAASIPDAGEKKANADDASTYAKHAIAIAALKTSTTSGTKTLKPDSLCPVSSTATVYQDYDFMLNQTNINQNNNSSSSRSI